MRCLRCFFAFLTAAVCAVLLYCLYLKAPNPLTRTLAPHNGSPWELGKLAYWSMLPAALTLHHLEPGSSRSGLCAAVLLAAEGKSEIFDRLFPNRFACAAGFAAMGAEVTAKGRQLMIAGGSRLRGAAVTAPDLRGGAALLVAALGADGTTTLRDPGHIRRGYADLPGEIRRLGAEIG